MNLNLWIIYNMTEKNKMLKFYFISLICIYFLKNDNRNNNLMANAHKLTGQNMEDSLNSCSLKLSDSKLGLLKETDLIYDSGKLGRKTWTDNANYIIKIEKETNLFYFYGSDSKDKDIDLVNL